MALCFVNNGILLYSNQLMNIEHDLMNMIGSQTDRTAEDSMYHQDPLFDWSHGQLRLNPDWFPGTQGLCNYNIDISD